MKSAKVPAVTLFFWIIKIFATTLGETAGDAMSMSLDLGYLLSSVIFFGLFLVAVTVQIRATKFHSVTYWLTIIATTTVGTTLADFADRSLGVGYAGGSLILVGALGLSLFVWYRKMGSISIASISDPKTEAFYWLTIMLSQTLGTAVGDWSSDSMELGYLGAAAIFGSLLLILAGLYFWTATSKTLLFWSAFILTRPLGAVVGDFLDKPVEQGGLALSRFTASLTLIFLITILLIIVPQKPAESNH